MYISLFRGINIKSIILISVYVFVSGFGLSKIMPVYIKDFPMDEYRCERIATLGFNRFVTRGPYPTTIEDWDVRVSPF